MMRKLLLLLVIAVAGLVVHDHSRRISEKDVRTHLEQQLMALRAFDSEPLCAAMADDFRVSAVEHAAGASQRATMDRTAMCQQLEDALAMMRMLSNQTGGLLAIDFAYEITSIEISPDGRRARVEATSTARLAGRLLSRSRAKGELSRSFWRVREHGGESQTWNYVP